MEIQRIRQTLKFITGHPLNKNNKLAAIAKYVFWQLTNRLTPGSRMVEYVNDTRLMIEHGMTGATGVVYAGLPDFEEMSFILHVGRRGDMLFDVGANVGIYTVLAAGGLGMHVVAFEPEAKAHCQLEVNIRLNHIEEKVKQFAIALGNRNTKCMLTTDLGPENHILVEDEGTSCAVVEIRRLDAIHLTAPNIMKIDVEGYEYEVLQGAEKTLRSDTLFGIIIETDRTCHRYSRSPQQTKDLLEYHGFKPYRYEPYRKALEPFNGSNVTRKNTIYIRDITYVERRIKTSLPFTIRNLTI